MKFNHDLTDKTEKASSELNENDLNAVAGGTEPEEEKKKPRKPIGPRVIVE